MAARILIAEDEESLTTLLRYNLDAAGYDLLGYSARWLAGLGVPQFGEYAVGGVLPDAVINALLAFLIGGWLLNVVNINPPHSWEK